MEGEPFWPRPHESKEVVFQVKLGSLCLQTEHGDNEILPSTICALEGMMMLISVQIKQ